MTYDVSCISEKQRALHFRYVKVLNHRSFHLLQVDQREHLLEQAPFLVGVVYPHHIQLNYAENNVYLNYIFAYDKFQINDR